MHKKSLLFFLGVIFFTLVKAQESKEVLLSIDNAPVYVSEFKRVYLKNIDLVKDESKKDVDDYLDLFINYKLKLKEAKALGLDKKETYLKELEGYSKQLSKGYLTDTQTSEALIKEAYDRSQERINASHILIGLNPNATPKDTLAAYQKISEARNKILDGASFESIAKTYSQDPSVSKNDGKLGWFSVFRMVYPFENSAYTTKVGELSKPFKTQFGYHILKVNNREKMLGEVTVAHIMVAINDTRSAVQAEERIKEINQQLKQGAPFGSLAKQYSDDPSTAVDGGKIRRFGQGALNSEKFENAAFSLQNKGEISSPLQTKYGWHIIQLIEKHPVKTFEEEKEKITKRVEKDSRSKLVTTSFIASLKEKYNVVRNEEAIQYFKKNISDSFLTNEWEIPADDQNLKKPLFQIKKEQYTYSDFARFLKKEQSRAKNFTEVSLFIDEAYKQFESATLLEYYKTHLEEDNQDYANVIQEYRDGLLLFDLMESKIWNASRTDSVGLKQFYESKKNKYAQNETYTVLKASSSKQEIIDKVQKLLGEGKSVDEIKKEINSGDIVLVIFSEEEMIKGEGKFPKGFKAEKGKIFTSEEENYITLIMVKEILPSRIKTFEEIKGEVINDFQEDMERKWLGKLKTKYTVDVNEKILKKVKRELSK
ncbi:peptidylprolyl isomerase [Aquimarina mytili]|uniref:Peptidylprolyl isomerase n=1 Tax=Aquimarina mytili TaxID=874423 RepID=A0A936ZRB4_9FLAO|nr:peptidylprolyl isomerase [Aquimarina mytili]MBL0684209.1 peptidylprolyl isomerase [Aquimarina mytili]